MSRLFSPTQSSRMRAIQSSKSPASAALRDRQLQKSSMRQTKGVRRRTHAAPRSPSRVPPGSPVFTLDMHRHNSDVQPPHPDGNNGTVDVDAAHAMSDTDSGSSEDGTARLTHWPDTAEVSGIVGRMLSTRSPTVVCAMTRAEGAADAVPGIDARRHATEPAVALPPLGALRAIVEVHERVGVRRGGRRRRQYRGRRQGRRLWQQQWRRW